MWCNVARSLQGHLVCKGTCCCSGCTVGQQMWFVNLSRCQQLSDGHGSSRTGEAAAAAYFGWWWHSSGVASLGINKTSPLCRHCSWQRRVWILYRPLPCRVPYELWHSVPGTIPWKADSVVCIGCHCVRLAVDPWAAVQLFNGCTVPARQTMAAVLTRWNLAVFNSPILDSAIWFHFNEVSCTRSLWRPVHCWSCTFQGWPQLSEVGWWSSLAAYHPIQHCPVWFFTNIALLSPYP